MEITCRSSINHYTVCPSYDITEKVARNGTYTGSKLHGGQSLTAQADVSRQFRELWQSSNEKQKTEKKKKKEERK